MEKQKKSAINDCLLGIKRGDKSYLDRLYDLIGATTRHIALKYLRDDEQAKELEQDFWADIFRIADGYNFIQNGFSYLCKVIERMAINRYYRVRHEQRCIVDYLSYVDYGVVGNFSEELLIEEIDTQIAVNKAMELLTDLQKSIIQMVYFEEKIVREMAKILGMTKSTVGRQRKEAMQIVKQSLEQQLHLEDTSVHAFAGGREDYGRQTV